MPFEERIDVHGHFISPAYKKACSENGYGKPDGMPAIPEWSVDLQLDMMQQLNISKSVLSISSPGTYLKQGDVAFAKKVMRDCNEYAAGLVKEHPETFGFWALLPLPDIDPSLEEITFALDTLKANGVAVHTNRHGIYLGDKKLDAVFDELNRRHAKVFIHPTSPCLKDCHGQGPTNAAPMSSQYPNPMFEFMFETARAVINLLLSGTVERCQNITFIISHAGGALPPIIDRKCALNAWIKAGVPISSADVRETFSKQFYFDLADLPFPDEIHGLLRWVGKDRLLYGSGFPFTPASRIQMGGVSMDKGMEEWSEEEMGLVFVGNAQKMLKRWQIVKSCF